MKCKLKVKMEVFQNQQVLKSLDWEIRTKSHGKVAIKSKKAHF